MAIDLKRLVHDAKKAQAKRPVALVGRETTGVTRAIRHLLPTIRELRTAGVTWAAIAIALAEQQVTQANGEPLTASRLTSIVGQIKTQDKRKILLAETRRQRSVAPSLVGATASHKGRFKLAPELTARPEPEEAARPSTEEEIRRAHYDKHRHLFKKE